ncbi:MAG: methyltransferase family protein [Anaerolineae bacterium]
MARAPIRVSYSVERSRARGAAPILPPAGGVARASVFELPRAGAIVSASYGEEASNGTVPDLAFSLLNGWLFIAALALTDGVLFLIFPKHVVTRLWDRSGWSPKQTAFTVFGKLFALAGVSMLVFTPLKLGSPVFIIGTVIALLGLGGLAKALIDFRNTPPGQPVTRGIYRISRHPQIVMSSVVILGASVAIGSWVAVLALVVARVLSHFGILAEEEICLEMYGEDYRAYMERVPRYFVVF